MKAEPGVEPEVMIKEEEKEEKKEERKEKDIVKKEEKDREREREKERERSIRSGMIKEEKEKPGNSSHTEESGGERMSMVGGSKRKEMEQLKIVRTELKWAASDGADASIRLQKLLVHITVKWAFSLYMR